MARTSGPPSHVGGGRYLFIATVTGRSQRVCVVARDKREVIDLLRRQYGQDAVWLKNIYPCRVTESRVLQ